MAAGICDPIEAIIWQHCGVFFRARTLFDSGLVSGPSRVIEPLAGQVQFKRDKYGAGVYLAPGTRFGLLVGDETIHQLTEPVIRPRQVKLAKAKDIMGRPAVAMVYDTFEGEGAKEQYRITEVRTPIFVTDDWNQTTYETHDDEY